MYEFDEAAAAAAADDDDFWTEMESDIQNFSVVTTATGEDGQTMVVVDVQSMQN